MATYTVQTVSDAGVTPSLVAVAASDNFADDGSGRTFVEVNNAGGAAITVTVPAQTATVTVPGVGSVTVPNISVSVTNGQRRFIGPFTLAYRNSSGLVTVNYSATTSVTAGAFLVAKED